MAQSTRPFYSTPCWHVRRLERWALETAATLPSARRREALRCPRGRRGAGAYRGGRPPTACFHRVEVIAEKIGLHNTYMHTINTHAHPLTNKNIVNTIQSKIIVHKLKACVKHLTKHSIIKRQTGKPLPVVILMVHTDGTTHVIIVVKCPRGGAEFASN